MDKQSCCSHSLNRELPRLDPGKLPPGYFDFTNEDPRKTPALRDIDAERLASASGSSSVPTAPPEPPEHTKDGRRLTKKERKAVGIFPEFHSQLSCSSWLNGCLLFVYSLKIRPAVRHGLTCQYRTRQTYHGYIAKSRHSDCVTRLTRRGSTERSRERARELRVCLNTSLCVFLYLYTFSPGSRYGFFLLCYRLVLSCQPPRPLALRAATIYPGRNGNERLWTSL